VDARRIGHERGRQGRPKLLRVALPEMIGTVPKVRRLLVRQGVKVRYQTLRRYALEWLHFGQAKPTVPVAPCEPGAEVQLGIV